MKVSSTEFQQNVGRYQDVAMREPVTTVTPTHAVPINVVKMGSTVEFSIAARATSPDDDFSFCVG